MITGGNPYVFWNSLAAEGVCLRIAIAPVGRLTLGHRNPGLPSGRRAMTSDTTIP